ncbi:MAG: hypothetical protein CMI54_08670 [Parcubacteria group bacterium]|nr:hypothetical protein [Parcubacteria group bacterium]|tara:strand:+ start:670 stop:876 length:207 start_codon:yes stop_codon:yes gene_type:complete
MNKTVHIDSLPDSIRRKIGKELGVPTRTYKFKADDVRSYAIKVLGPISGLTQNERGRVLKKAMEMNKV